MIMTRQFYGLPALSSVSSNPIQLSKLEPFIDAFSFHGWERMDARNHFPGSFISLAPIPQAVVPFVSPFSTQTLTKSSPDGINAGKSTAAAAVSGTTTRVRLSYAK
jgi:hypothetical protein